MAAKGMSKALDSNPLSTSRQNKAKLGDFTIAVKLEQISPSVQRLGTRTHVEVLRSQITCLVVSKHVL